MSPHLGKARGWAAVFFGDTALELTTARPAGSELSVVLQTTEPLAVPLEGQVAGSRYATTAQTLHQRVDLQEHRIVTTIPCEEVLCQTLRLPTTEASELQQMLDLQIDNLTPFPIEEVVYSFEALESTQNETRVLVALARKADVNQRVAALEAVGWRPESVVIDGLSVCRELLRNGVLPSDAKLNALVLVNPAAANIFAFSGGNMVVVRSVMLGKPGLSDAGTQLAVQEELTRTLVAAETERPGLVAGQVAFATWNDPLRAPLAELAQRWDGSSVVLANGSSPSPALSVCLESARRGAQHLNLLPEEWRERRRQARVRRLLIRGGIALAVLYALAMAAFLSLLAVQKTHQKLVESKLTRVAGPYRDAQELHKTLLAMRRQLDTKYSAIEILREVAELLPENVKLTGFTFKKDDSVKLRAQAQSVGIANDFISRLEKSSMFAKVSPDAMHTDPGGSLTKFDILCTLNSTGSYADK